MITEDYVSFETAKLLKEKGFDEYGMYFYTLEDKGEEGYKSNKRLQELAHNSHPELEGRAVSCPTLQMAMKWLREKHNIHIELMVLKPYETDEHRHATPKEGVTYHAEIFHINEWNEYLEEFKHVGISQTGAPEEVCEAAIRYCLENLI